MVDRQLRISQPVKVPMRLKQKIAMADCTGDILSLQFDADDKYLAAACGDGQIKIFNTFTGKLTFSMAVASHEAMPMTCVRWRPQISGDQKGTSQVIATTQSDGLIQHWHVSSGKCSHSMKAEGENNLYALDFSQDGRIFAVGGSDTYVYTYDEVTKQQITSMKVGGKNLPGHSSRIFVVKFHPQDQNILLSGGWDKTIQIYDLRQGRTIGSIFGPNISGDALDVYDDMIITGSNRNKEMVQMFSFSKRQLIHNIEWETSSRKDIEAGYLFGARFSKPNPNLIIAGGAGRNEVKVFENNADGGATFRLMGSIQELEAPCLAIDASKTGDSFAFGCQDGRIFICNYKQEEGMDFEGYQGGIIKEQSEKHHHKHHAVEPVEEEEEKKE